MMKCNPFCYKHFCVAKRLSKNQSLYPQNRQVSATKYHQSFSPFSGCSQTMSHPALESLGKNLSPIIPLISCNLVATYDIDLFGEL